MKSAYKDRRRQVSGKGTRKRAVRNKQKYNRTGLRQATSRRGKAHSGNTRRQSGGRKSRKGRTDMPRDAIDKETHNAAAMATKQ